MVLIELLAKLDKTVAPAEAGVQKSLKNLIGVGTAERPLPPPNRAGGFPAHGSPVGGSPTSGLTGRRMGFGQEEKPMFGKESIGPTEMIEPVATSGAPMTSAKDTAQAHSYPAIQRAKGRAMTVLEILKPADQGPIQVRDDRRKALTPHALRLYSDGVFELLETLGPRPTFTLLEMITQKVKPAGGAGIDNPSFRRVQRKSGLGCPCLNQS